MSTSSGFIIEEIVPISRNSLVGFARVRTPSGTVFHDVGLYRKDNKVWASPPSKPKLSRDGTHLKDAAGKGLWTPVVSFSSKEIRDRWSTGIIEAVRASHSDVLE
jgi:hypothetical protein